MEFIIILILIIIISLIAYAHKKEQLLSILEKRFDDLTEENESLKKALLKYKSRIKRKKWKKLILLLILKSCSTTSLTYYVKVNLSK